MAYKITVKMLHITVISLFFAILLLHNNNEDMMCCQCHNKVKPQFIPFSECSEKCVEYFMDKVFNMYFGKKNSELLKHGAILTVRGEVLYIANVRYENEKGKIIPASFSMREKDIMSILGI